MRGSQQSKNSLEVETMSWSRNWPHCISMCVFLLHHTYSTVQYYGFSRTNCSKKNCSNALKLFRPRLLHAMHASLCSMQFFYASPCGQTNYCTLKTQLLFSYCTKIYQYETEKPRFSKHWTIHFPNSIQSLGKLIYSTICRSL